MLAGPGAMSSVAVLMTQNADWTHPGIVLAAVATASLVSFLVLAAADRVGSYLHETGIRIFDAADGASADRDRGTVHSRWAARCGRVR